MSLKVDFTGVSSGFEVLPEGTYCGRIEKVELKTSKAGDSQYLNITWAVTDENGKERKVWDIASLKPAALWKLKQILEAIGESTDGAIDLDLDALVDREADLEIGIDTYEGKEKNVIKNVKPLSFNVATTGI